jgi:hypothetical protein
MPRPGEFVTPTRDAVRGIIEGQGAGDAAPGYASNGIGEGRRAGPGYARNGIEGEGDRAPGYARNGIDAGRSNSAASATASVTGIRQAKFRHR